MKKIWFPVLVCLISFSSLINNASAWDYPLIVDLIHIKFDYESGYAYDALDIRKNQSGRKIQADFTHNQDDVYTLGIVAFTTYGEGFGYPQETPVDFPNGGPASPYTTFTTYGSVPNSVGKRSFKWKWYITKVNGVPFPWGDYLWFTDTGWHTHYTLLAAPQNPMSVPWTDVLDYACVWASGKSSESQAVSEITEKAYTSLGKNYYGEATHAQGTTFNLTGFLSSSWADCRDMSATVHVFTRAIGGTATAVWWIDGGMYTKAIKIIGGSSWQIKWFAFHQVAYRSGVYDACLKLRQAVGVNERVPKGENMDNPYKRDLFDHGDWEPDDGSFSYDSVN